MTATVLVVEDEYPIRLLVRVNLEAEGFNVVEAPDGAAAVEVLKNNKPDAVFLDVMLPQMNGWEVASWMLSDEEARKVPVVFLTARADIKGVVEFPENCLWNIIIKPFEPRALGEAVRSCLKNGVREPLANELEPMNGFIDYFRPGT